MKTTQKLLSVAVYLSAGFSCLAQAVPANFDPSYEVASIKPSDPMENRAMLMFNPGKLSVKNIPLASLITFAYDLKSESLLTNAPDWVKQQRYDIDAKEEEEETKLLQKVPIEQRTPLMRRMVQKLLEERLHLKLTKEQKEQPVYLLVVAKSGPKLKPTTAPPPPTPGSEPTSAPRTMRGMRMTGRGDVTGTDAPASMIADLVARMPEAGGRVVLDKTGLTGRYDFTLKWAPEIPAPAFRGADAAAPPPPAGDAGGPTLVTALEEQLGLKLEAGKAMVDSYRVDNIDKPSEN